MRNVLSGLAILALVGSAALMALWFFRPTAAEPEPSTPTLLSAGLPTPTATLRRGAWEDVIQGELLAPRTAPPPSATPAPTHTPTLPVLWQQTPTPVRFQPERPTMPPPTAVTSPQAPAIARNNDPRRGEFSPPPEQVPLSLDPRDHFWLRRPVDSSANSAALFSYPYGSSGPNNAWRVHHGIDLPNPIGKEVRAAAAGRVIWAADNYVWYENGRYVESAYSYGNVVIIEHNFGFQGKRLYTLYAHLQLILVHAGQDVQTGEVIGLSGRSGVVSGPHVHFEVRVWRNSYYETRNPLLWMAPYENHGVVAGRVTLPDGSLAQDVNVVLMKDGRAIDRTTTYVNPRQPRSRTWNVNSDEVWRENFVIGDVPVGIYQVVVFLNGRQLVRDVTVRPATTSFVDFTELEVVPLPTPSPTPAG
ncbi:MAG: peptidoglycan DD-metalloendopeptidase family protein [Aggregatilineales bacterium]